MPKSEKDCLDQARGVAEKIIDKCARMIDLTPDAHVNSACMLENLANALDAAVSVIHEADHCDECCDEEECCDPDECCGDEGTGQTLEGDDPKLLT